MQAGSEPMGTPKGHSAHGLPPHIGAGGRHGGTATAWKSAKIGHFCCHPCYAKLVGQRLTQSYLILGLITKIPFRLKWADFGLCGFAAGGQQTIDVPLAT